MASSSDWPQSRKEKEVRLVNLFQYGLADSEAQRRSLGSQLARLQRQVEPQTSLRAYTPLPPTRGRSSGQTPSPNPATSRAWTPQRPLTMPPMWGAPVSHATTPPRAATSPQWMSLSPPPRSVSPAHMAMTPPYPQRMSQSAWSPVLPGPPSAYEAGPSWKSLALVLAMFAAIAFWLMSYKAWASTDAPITLLTFDSSGMEMGQLPFRFIPLTELETLGEFSRVSLQNPQKQDASAYAMSTSFGDAPSSISIGFPSANELTEGNFGSMGASANSDSFSSAVEALAPQSRGSGSYGNQISDNADGRPAGSSTFAGRVREPLHEESSLAALSGSMQRDTGLTINSREIHSVRDELHSSQSSQEAYGRQLEVETQGFGTDLRDEPPGMVTMSPSLFTMSCAIVLVFTLAMARLGPTFGHATLILQGGAACKAGASHEPSTSAAPAVLDAIGTLSPAAAHAVGVSTVALVPSPMVTACSFGGNRSKSPGSRMPLSELPMPPQEQDVSTNVLEFPETPKKRQRRQWPSGVISPPFEPDTPPAVNVSEALKRSRQDRNATPEPPVYKARKMYLASVGKNDIDFMDSVPQPYPFKSQRLREEAEKEIARIVAAAADAEEALLTTSSRRSKKRIASGRL